MFTTVAILLNVAVGLHSFLPPVVLRPTHRPGELVRAIALLLQIVQFFAERTPIVAIASCNNDCRSYISTLLERCS